MESSTTMELPTTIFPTRPPCSRNPKTKVSDCPCLECRVKTVKGNIPHPLFPPPNTGKMRDYYEVGLNGTNKCVTMLREPGSMMTHYKKADSKTQALICDELDTIGVLFTSGVLPPPDYSRQAKCAKRDTPVPRTSDRLPGHKKERGTCPVKECQDRSGMCDCMCHTCFGVAKECRCCKTCCNIEGECACPILEFLSAWV